MGVTWRDGVKLKARKCAYDIHASYTVQFGRLTTSILTQSGLLNICSQFHHGASTRTFSVTSDATQNSSVYNLTSLWHNTKKLFRNQLRNQFQPLFIETFSPWAQIRWRRLGRLPRPGSINEAKNYLKRIDAPRKMNYSKTSNCI